MSASPGFWATERRVWIIVSVVAAINTVIATVIALSTWDYSFFEAWSLLNLLVFFVGLCLAPVWVGFSRFQTKLLWYAFSALLTAVLLVALGAGLTDWLYGHNVLEMFERRLRIMLISGLSFGLLFVGSAIVIAQLRNREMLVQTARLEVEKQQSELSRQLSESRLKLMRAQIEPHFVFNTLGSAQQLAEGKAPEAARLLSSLILFLRAAVPSLRDETTTLAHERQLLNAYLEVMKTRFRSRLNYQIDFPDSLTDARLPPGMLLTLVENAIKHGIEPVADGGDITIRARLESERLRLEVQDTGKGMQGELASGVGLANIRERLAIIYGEDAVLMLQANQPRGFAAILEIPYERSKSVIG